MTSYHIDTKCIQSGYSPKDGEPRVVPIVQSTTFRYESAETLGKLESVFKQTQQWQPLGALYERRLAKNSGDPELLGKVFENLLASYNEDTKTTARKALGAFYTPRELVSYMVDEALMLQAKSSAIFLHCLPAHRGEEVTDAVIEGPQSRVFAAAENRLEAILSRGLEKHPQTLSLYLIETLPLVVTYAPGGQ